MPEKRETVADLTMDAVSEAVMIGRDGDVKTARRRLLAVWQDVGVLGDPFYRCTIAHYLADLYESPAESLVWDIRALDAADALTEQRVQNHHASLRVDAFYPSLHLNLADDFRRLAAFQAASHHIVQATAHVSALPDDAYGDMIRTAIRDVTTAIAAHDTAPRPSHPGGAAAG